MAMRFPRGEKPLSTPPDLLITDPNSKIRNGFNYRKKRGSRVQTTRIIRGCSVSRESQYGHPTYVRVELGLVLDVAAWPGGADQMSSSVYINK